MTGADRKWWSPRLEKEPAAADAGMWEDPNVAFDVFAELERLSSIQSTRDQALHAAFMAGASWERNRPRKGKP